MKKMAKATERDIKFVIAIGKRPVQYHPLVVRLQAKQMQAFMEKTFGSKKRR